MELRDELLTVAELAVGIAGFSAIVAAFFRGRRLSNVDIERFRGLLVAAASAVALAFIPSLLESSGFSGATLWRVASCLMIAVWCTAMIPFALRIRSIRLDPNAELMPPVPFVAAIGVPSIGNLAIQISNVSGALWAPGGSAYLFGTLVWLWAAGVIFATIVMHRPAAQQGVEPDVE